MTAMLIGFASSTHAQTITHITGIPGPAENLGGLWGTDRDNLFAAGGYQGLSHFDGTAWSSQDVSAWANRYRVFGTGTGVVYSAGQGGYMSGSLVRSVNGGPWTLAFAVNTELTSLWVSPTGEVLVGGDGRFFHSADGVSFQESPTGLSHGFLVDRLESIWGRTSDDAYAASWGGLYHWDGSQFSAAMMPKRIMLDVHYSGSSWWATTATGEVWQRIGDEWTLVHSLPGRSFMSIWAFADNDVWVGGNYGTLQHFDGTSWTMFDSGTTKALPDMFAVDKRTLYAAVSDGPAELLRIDIPRTAVPEPGSLALLLVPALTLVALHGHQRRKGRDGDA